MRHKAIEYAGKNVCTVAGGGGSGGMPPRKFLSFKRSEIDSGAFWDTFPRRRTRTNLYSSDRIY